MGHSSKPFLGAAAALLFAACATAVQGQQMTAAERAARERMSRDAVESTEREMMLAEVERYHRSGERREPRLALAQIREDFVRLQVLNNDLANSVAGGAQLDFKLVAKSASEIRKRAERLKENLALPEADGAVKPPESAPPADPEQLRTALSRLNGIIRRFASGLHASGVGRLEAASSARLRLDLQAIIGLSERVRKGSEKLGEASR